MGGSDPPYLYDPPSNRSSQITYAYSDFNPRAATQAHYMALAERAERQRHQAQQNGKPLISFNQHPDSYMIVNNPTTTYEPLPENTKSRIVWTRWLQFVFRVLQEIGAVGILVCVICLKMKSDGPGYIIRVTPAWDMLITLYAIYHLLRPAKGRTPSSSASYHFFALFMDTGLIPFYIYMALYANQNYNEVPGVNDRWTSVFTASHATTTVIYATFLATIVMGGLHLISIGMDLYLIVMFRKIAYLPPDMNPFEDNLTGSSRRRSQKHKHKNSEMSASSVSTTSLAEKNSGYLSGSTLGGNNADLSAVKQPEARTMSFGHSRMDSSDAYSPHNPKSARLSRQHFDEVSMYHDARSARSSRINLDGDQQPRPGSSVSTAQNTSVVDFGSIPPIPRSTNAERPYTPRTGTFSTEHISRGPGPDRVETASQNAVVKSQQKQSLLNDNWYVLDDEAASDMGTPRYGDRLAPPHSAQPTLPKVELNRVDSFEPRPLAMHPPTPPPPRAQTEFPDPSDDDRYEPTTQGVSRQLTVSSQETSSSVYSESAPSLNGNGRPNNGTPKGKYYGDLASATRGVRGTNQYGVPSPQASRTPSPEKKGRVISRTGADIADIGLYVSSDQQYSGLRGRRDVSGKVAEEGRGGSWR